MGKVIPFGSNKSALIKAIRRLAQDSRNLVITDAMGNAAGRVSIAEVAECLDRGEISHGPHLDERGNPTVELEVFVAGRFIYLSVVVEKGKLIHVLHISEG